VGTAPTHDVPVEGWTNLFNLNWAADGKGWCICNRPVAGGSTLLYVDLKADATLQTSPRHTVRNESSAWDSAPGGEGDLFLARQHAAAGLPRHLFSLQCLMAA
jgi:hypothetical protein